MYPGATVFDCKMTRSTMLSVSHKSRIGFALILMMIASLYIIYGVNLIRWRNSPDFGWRTMYDSGPNVVAQVLNAGKAAGLRVGDTILAINGKSYTTFDQLYFKIRHNEPGSVNTYTVQRDGKTFEISIPTNRLGFWAVLKRSGPIFAIGLVYVFIGVIVFLMKPQAGESWLFLIMTCFLGMEISFAAPSDLMKPMWFFDIRLFINVMLPSAIIHLALRFPKTRSFLLKRPWLWTIPYLFSITLFILMELTSTAVWDVPTVLEKVNSLYLMLAVLIFLVSMIWNFLKDTSVLIRLQSQAIFLGMLIGIFIPVADLIGRILWETYLFPDPALGFAVFLSLFPLSIGYTIVKHDLFDIDAVIKRTYGYVLTTGSIAGIYAILVLISNLAFGRFEVTKSPLFPLIFILGVVFFFNPIRNRIQKFIDRVFYRLEYDYQETVQKISETMRSLLKVDEIGQRIMETVLGTMFIDAGCVMLLNPVNAAYECLTFAGKRELRGDQSEPRRPMSSGDGSRLETSSINDQDFPRSGPSETADKNMPASNLLTHRLDANEPFIQKLSERKKEVTIYDIHADPFYEDHRTSCKETFDRLQSTLIVPLIYEDKLTGLISLGEKKSGKFYRREDINLLNTLANQGAMAIENARMIEEVIEKERMEEELSIARDLQTSMLPAECPAIGGFEIAAYSLSAREVGGDFYDFIDMGEDRVGMVIGDVTGKSVSGALVMSASRSVFRMLSEENLGVGEIMVRANRRTKKDIKPGMFVALLYAVLDAKDRTLSLCSAGQTQPIHWSSTANDSKLIETLGDNFPLGILDDADYQETRLHLEPGDKVVLYTDGIVEAMNEKEEIFGFERLLETVQEAYSLNANALLKKILDKVDAFAGEAAQHDDLTVIVVNAEG
jgi:serine phosphatase RsbU (regulator of sigma subunit)